MNKFLKKSLSIALAIAMLMTVCAVSFGASAAVGSSVSWDFTDDTVNAANLDELKDNATFIGASTAITKDNYVLGRTDASREQYESNAKINRLVIPEAAEFNKNINGFVLDGVVPSKLSAVVQERRRSTDQNTVGSTFRATPGIVFAKDDYGYFVYTAGIYNDSKTATYVINYIKKADNGTYSRIRLYNGPAIPKITHVTGIDGSDVTDTHVKEDGTILPQTSWNIGGSFVIHNDVVFEGKKATFTTTVENISKSRLANSEWFKDFTLESFTIDFDNISKLVSEKKEDNVIAGTYFVDRYKDVCNNGELDVSAIDFVAGIAIAGSGQNGGFVNSFSGEFGGACTHPTVEKRNVKEATCLVNGSYDEYCTVCGKYVRTVTTTGTHDDNCSCLKLFPSVVITDGVIGVSLKAGMSVISSGTNNSWEMEMKIHGVDADWVRASQTSQSLGTGLEGLADNQQDADQLVDGVYYFSKVYPGKTIDPVTGEETTEEDNSNAVHMTDITKFYDQMTQEITVDVRYAPIYVGVAPSGKAQGDYIFGEGSYDSANAYPFEESHARSKTFKFTIADLLKGVYENENNSEEFRSLAVKTANYGAAAQDYFQYENDYSGNRANDWVKDASLKAIEDNAYAGVKDVAKVENKKEGVKVAATVQLKNKLGIAVSINQNDARAYLVDGDKETELTTEAAKQGDEIVGTKAAYFGITATQMANGYTIRFKDSDGNTLADVTYSVNSYIARQGKKETTSAALKTLVNAMAEFYTAAVKVVEA